MMIDFLEFFADIEEERSSLDFPHFEFVPTFPWEREI